MSSHLAPTTPAVDFDRLARTADGNGEATLEGRLFSGISFERDGTGCLVSLGGHTNGKAHGPARVWSPSGRILVEQYFDGGSLHGPYREWYPNGQPCLDAYYEHGYWTRKRSFDEGGVVLEDERLDPMSDVAAQVAERRTRRKREIVDIDLKTWRFIERPAGWGADGSDLPAASALKVPAFPPHLP